MVMLPEDDLDAYVYDISCILNFYNQQNKGFVGQRALNNN